MGKKNTNGGTKMRIIDVLSEHESKSMKKNPAKSEKGIKRGDRRTLYHEREEQ
jgi:hypothetical protein